MPLWALAGALVAVAAMLLVMRLGPGQRVITQDDIHAAVRSSLEKEPLPSAAAKAFEAILPSVNPWQRRWPRRWRNHRTRP